MGEKSGVEKQRFLLGLALLSYMTLLVLIMTQMPFTYRWPGRLHIFWMIKPADVASNLILFFPLGFFFRMSFSSNRDHAGLRVLLYGFLLSLLIEALQVFIKGRYPSPADIACNAAGAWIGARVYVHAEGKFNSILLKKLALHHPMINIVYLLIPLLWLTEITAFSDPSRLWFLPLIGIMGGYILMVVFSRQLEGGKGFSPVWWVIIFFLSFVSILWVFNTSSPFYFFLISIFVTLGLLTVNQFRKRKESSTNKRFEVETLKKIIPVYCFYLFLLACWPLELPSYRWEAKAGLLYGAENVEIMKLIEYLAAYTLFGYLIAEYRGRMAESLVKTRMMVLVCVVLFGGIMEILRGFHPYYAFSWIQLFLIVTVAFYGSLIYHLQLNLVKELRSKIQLP